MKNGKFFIVNGRPKTRPPQPISPPLSTLSSMTVGGWGDPHMYITTSSLDSKNRVITKTIAQWGDNKPGTAGNNELILLDLQTSTNTIKVLYTNKAYGTAKVVSNVRVIYNGTSTTYNNTIKFTAGPVNIKILKIGSGNNAYLNFEISWSDINNVVKLGGAIVPILKRVASSNGTLWNGGDGALWDGFGKALAPYGLTRSSFETGISIQAVSEELILSENEASFLTIATENFTQNSNIFDNLQNLGENGEGDNANIGDWDATYSDILPVLSDPGGLEGAIDIAVSDSTTTTTTTTTTPAPGPTCLYRYTGNGGGGQNYWVLIGGSSAGCPRDKTTACSTLTFNPCLPEQAGCNNKYGQTTDICSIGSDGSISKAPPPVISYYYTGDGCSSCETYGTTYSECPEGYTLYSTLTDCNSSYP